MLAAVWMCMLYKLLLTWHKQLLENQQAVNQQAGLHCSTVCATYITDGVDVPRLSYSDMRASTGRRLEQR